MPFLVHCDRCKQKFTNARTLEKHHLVKHSLNRPQKPIFFNEQGEQHLAPKASLLSARKKFQYKRCLSCVVERINGAHHPGFKGRWFRVDISETPEEYFYHILSKLNVQANSIRLVSHMRPPMLRKETPQYLYKLFDLWPVKEMFAEHTSMTFKERCTYEDDKESTLEDQAFDPLAALNAGKKRAILNVPGQTSCRSRIIVEDGETQTQHDQSSLRNDNLLQDLHDKSMK